MGFCPVFSTDTIIPSKPVKKNKSLYKWKLIKSETIGRFLIVYVKFKDAPNYNGEKILVFEDINLNDLNKQKWISPHFLNEDGIYPIARFVPTSDGWHNAIVMTQAITLGG